MNQGKKYTGVIIGIADCYIKTAIALEEALAVFYNYAEEVNEAMTRVSELLINCTINEMTLSPIPIEELFAQINDNTENLTGTPPKEYARSLRKRHRQPRIHYNFIPRTHRNQPYQRRIY